MSTLSVRHWLVSILAVALLTIVTNDLATAQTPDDLAALNAQVETLYDQGKYAEATGIAKQLLRLAEKKFGPDHVEVGTALNRLAELSLTQRRHAEAEALYKRSLGIRETALGPEHPDVARSLNGLAVLYEDQNRHVEAEVIFQRALAISEKALGGDHPFVGGVLNNLAHLYRDLGRYPEAESLFRRRLHILETSFGLDDPRVTSALDKLAQLYNVQGRVNEAEPLYLRSLTISETALGRDHPSVADTLTTLVGLYRGQGRYSEAVQLSQRALAIFEKVLGLEHPAVAMSLNNLGVLFQALGLEAEAEQPLQRGLAIRETALGRENIDVANSLHNIGALFVKQGRYAEAEPLFQRALAIYEALIGTEHGLFSTPLNSLADLYTRQGRYAEAEPLSKRALAIRINTLGPDHSYVANSLSNLAVLYTKSGRVGDAEPLMKRALIIRKTTLGHDHPDVGDSLYNIAAMYTMQSEWKQAADWFRQSTAHTVGRFEFAAASERTHSAERAPNERDQQRDRFLVHVKVLNRTLQEHSGELGAFTADTFTTAQLAQNSKAATSLALMAARGATENFQLAPIVRERQDLVAEWKGRDEARSAAVSQLPGERSAQAEAVNVARLNEINSRISDIDARLKTEFPDYAALSNPGPLSIEQAQPDLRPDEALVLFLDTPEWGPMPEETFVWVVTRTDVRWVRTDFGTEALKREVAALRCGLDATSWHGDGAKRCAELLKFTPDKLPKPNGPLPFDANRAHDLYKALFGEVADLIKGKHLLLVPSGPLTQLPFQVLVTEAPKGADHKSIRWLARDHALTVLPAVSSLKALRRVSRPSTATKPMIGFGNPLLDGDQGHPRYGAENKLLAVQARSHKGCAQLPSQRTAALRGENLSATGMPQQSGLVDVALVRLQTPLPETADELCAVGRDLNADVSEIRLGALATEREIKALSASGLLADYRILHFATHATLAGQLRGTTEPGLILTPPDKATQEDDGYLSGGEIAALKLDADWVILSACNTAGAGGSESSAEALSGLARAFFYAQARALLVSHWEVNSDATVRLITSAVRAISNDKSVGRAEAIRRAMLFMIDNDSLEEAHPSNWAPFVVVGEGAAAR